MPNFASVLKDEISRLARKEAKRTEKSLRDSVAFLRQTILSQKKKIASLDKEVALLLRESGLSHSIEIAKPEEVEKSRFSPKLIARLRAKLDLSRSEMAALVGVNPNSIFLWEKGQTSPRFAAKAKLLELRSLGKRELKKRLGGLKVETGATELAEVKKKTAKPKKQKKVKKAKKVKAAAKPKVARAKPLAKKPVEKVAEQGVQAAQQASGAEASKN